MGKLLTYLAILLCSVATTYGQCAEEQTFTVCDMTVIDGSGDGNPDGIVNLYEELSAITGTTITTADGMFVDPAFNFALNETTGDLFLWDLRASSENVDDYQFQFINTTSGCPNDIEYLFNVVLGPYSGDAAPTVGTNAVNLQVCQERLPSGCPTNTTIDLYETMLSNPSPHLNGVWTYMGDSDNFIRIEGNRLLVVDIPYQEGPPLVDEETFDLMYTVPGISPCSLEAVTSVRVSVVREPFAGFASEFNICESDILAGNFDMDINLLDDEYLLDEDIEGTWSSNNDPTGQISGLGDSMINIREIYDDLYATNQRFGCATFEFTYFVESRSTVCDDQFATVKFTIMEYIRPFVQVDVPEFCVGDESVIATNLYDVLEFQNENGVVYDYPNNACTNWEFVSGPSDLGLNSNSGSICSLGEDGDADYTSLGTIDLSSLTTNAAAGTYTFRYTVKDSYNCLVFDPSVTYPGPLEACIPSTDGEHPCDDESTLVTIIVNPFNYAGEDTADLEFCETESPLTLTDLLETDGINDPIYVGPEGIWTDLGTGTTVANDFVIPDFTGDFQDFNLEYNTSTTAGCTDTATLDFRVYRQFNPGEDGPLVVCIDGGEVDLFTLLGGDPDTNGTWTGPNGFTTTDNVALFDPATGVEGEYMYTVPQNENCPAATATVTVTVEEPLYAGEDTTGVEICENLGTIDLITLLETNGTDTVDTSGEWTDGTGAIIPNPFTIPVITGSQEFNFIYTTTATNTCVDMATLSVTIFEQFMAGEDAMENLCQEAATINLFDLLGGTPDTNGVWEGPEGYTATGNTAPFDPSVDAPGDYMYTVPSNGACAEQTATVLITVDDGDYAGENTIGAEICENLGTIDLVTLLDTNGTDTVVTTGEWTDATGTVITNPFVIPAITGSQVFEFTYTTTSTEGCVNSATLSLTIFEQFDAGTSATVQLCQEALALNLFDELGGTPDTNGTWTGPDGYTTTDNNAPFDPMTDVAGDYIYTTPVNGVCAATTATVTVSFFDGDYAGEDTTGVEICENLGTIDLVTLLDTNGTDTVATTGEWTDGSGTVIANPFTIPAITGSQVFDFTYTTASVDGCVDSATLSVTIFEQFDAGTSATLQLCMDAAAVNLFDELGGTPDTNGTWTGPDGFSTTDNNAPFAPMTDAAGDYMYTTPANGACAATTATITVSFFPNPYAGEDTVGAEACDLSGTIDLTTLLETNGIDTVVTNGVWTDIASGTTISNPFTIPTITGSQSFDFRYNTTNADGCNDESTLSFTIFESGGAGIGASFSTCEDQATFNVFDLLTGTPDTTGTWSGPNGYSASGDTAMVNPATAQTGDYVYTVPANGACAAVTSTVSITVFTLSDAGGDVNTIVCPGDYTQNLFNLLGDNANLGGTFTDLATGQIVVDGLIEVAVLGTGSFSYDYTVSNGTCGPDSATINFTITAVPIPSFEIEEYCINDGTTLGDINVTINGADDFAWYAFAEAGDPLSLDTLLIDGDVFFLAAIDTNGCESERVQYVADILPLSNGECGLGITSGVSDNDDGTNDELELGSLPILFPDFDVQIFNRYGTIVYRGDRSTPLFNGSSNTGSGIGDQLPTGVYFYIFYPNAQDTEPIDGNFYLSR